jgi:hypothetical protein
MHARIISKGSDADVAAAAATHGLAVILEPATPSPYAQRTGFAYVNNPSRDYALHGRLAQWFGAAPVASPFPTGTLLFFAMVEESL